MPSPFPGMAPYIEQSKLWVDFHNGLADEIRTQLNTQIRPDYFARLPPYTTYEVVGISQVQRRSIRPDVAWATASAAVIEKAPAESVVETEALVDLLSTEAVPPPALSDEEAAWVEEDLATIRQR